MIFKPQIINKVVKSSNNQLFLIDFVKKKGNFSKERFISWNFSDYNSSNNIQRSIVLNYFKENLHKSENRSYTMLYEVV